MKSIGVRELRQQASEYLREVEGGRVIEIAVRGRAVALLVPVGAGGLVDRLVGRGRVRPATGDLLALGEPLAPVPGAALPSRRLQRARGGER